MKVLVAGAGGNTGRRIVRILRENEYDVRAMVRNPEQASGLAALGAEVLLADLEDQTPLLHAAEGCYAVMFAAGAGRGSGPARKETVDYGGAVKLMEAAQATGARRFILLSTIRLDYPELWREEMQPYLDAKKRADERLTTTDLAYTIVRPGRLTDGEGSGTVSAGFGFARTGEIAREDVALTMVTALGMANTEGRIVELLAGNTPIRTALEAI